MATETKKSTKKESEACLAHAIVGDRYLVITKTSAGFADYLPAHHAPPLVRPDAQPSVETLPAPSAKP